MATRTSTHTTTLPPDAEDEEEEEEEDPPVTEGGRVVLVSFRGMVLPSGATSPGNGSTPVSRRHQASAPRDSRQKKNPARTQRQIAKGPRRRHKRAMRVDLVQDANPKQGRGGGRQSLHNGGQILL